MWYQFLICLLVWLFQIPWLVFTKRFTGLQAIILKTMADLYCWSEIFFNTYSSIPETLAKSNVIPGCGAWFKVKGCSLLPPTLFFHNVSFIDHVDLLPSSLTISLSLSCHVP